MNRKKDYRDMEKFRKTCNRKNRRYYGKTSNICPRKEWTNKEDSMVLDHKISDSELSKNLERSVRAIKIRLHRLKY